jgi:dihydrofolate reductase
VIIGIVAIAKNFAIGKDGKLPWHYPEDLKFFKETTTGHAIVMGSRTWRSIGKPLPKRLNVVLSRSGIVEPLADVMQLSDTEEVLDLSRYLTRDMYIIGGASVFKTFADMIDRWIVTEVPLEVEDADVFMPRNFLDGFSEVQSFGLGSGLNVRVMQRNAT